MIEGIRTIHFFLENAGGEALKAQLSPDFTGVVVLVAPWCGWSKRQLAHWVRVRNA